MNLEDLDTLVVDADPALDVTIPSGSSAEARWRYVQLTGHPVAPTHHRRRLVRTAGLGAAAAAALVLVLVNVIPGSSGPKSAAAAVFEQAAAVAGQQNVQLTPGQYLYTETQSSYQVTLYDPKAMSEVQVATAQFDETDQAWTDASGIGSALGTDSTVQFPSVADETAWNADPAGRSMLQQIAHFAETGGQANTQQPPLDVSDLPTDPSALASVIANGELHTNVNLIPAGPNATFERAATLLLGPTTGMTPALASALFQVLANQPGVQLLGTVTDHEGQTGQAVALTTVTPADGLNVSKVIVDPATGRLLEAQFALPASTLPNPGGTMCTGPANAPISSLTCTAASSGHQMTIAPIWTDVVATGVVGSDTATLPSAGNRATTVSLVPGAPGGLSATPQNGPFQQVGLSWTAPTNIGASPITDYVIYEYSDGQTPGTGPSAVFDTHSTATNYSWLLAGAGQAATFTVQAVNADGYGAASNSVSVTP